MMYKIIKGLAVIFVALTLLNCSKKETEFILAPARVKTYEYAGIRYYNDVVFVVNPPNDTKQLVNLITKYNLKTINRAKIENRYDVFVRSFYRESSKTPRDFKDDNSFSSDLIGDHGEDYIASYKMKTCGIKKNEQIHEWSLWSSYESFVFDPVFYGARCQ